MRWIVDNSVLQRLPRSSEVAQAVARVLDDGDALCSTPVSALEAGYSVRSLVDHDALMQRLAGAFVLLPLTIEVGSTAVELQRALWQAGRGRAAGAMDLLLAACGVVHAAGILHYDGDFESIAMVDARLAQRWVVPPGTVD